MTYVRLASTASVDVGYILALSYGDLLLPMMFISQGNPLYSDDIGKMCFNGAKSWQIGWYNDRKVIMNPKTASGSTVVTLVGVANYKNVANIPVVLKLETDTVNDYFIAFNRATGINADNKEADDEVTVVLMGNNGESTSKSYLKATLLVGEQYAIAKFGGGARTCVIKLLSIDKSTSVWKAKVQVTMVDLTVSVPYSDNRSKLPCPYHFSNAENLTTLFSRKIQSCRQLPNPPQRVQH